MLPYMRATLAFNELKDLLLSALKYDCINILQRKNLGYVMFSGYEFLALKLEG